MKSTWTFLAAFGLFAASLGGQQLFKPTSIVEENTITGAFGLVQKSLLFYDADGNQTQTTNYSWTGAGWQLSSKSSQTFDAGGHQISSLSESLAGGVWTPTFRQLLTYDANGNQATSKNETWDAADGIWSLETFYSSTFSADTALLESIFQGFQAGSPIWGGKTSYQIDALSRPAVAFQESWSGGAWVKTGRDDYSYAGASVDFDQILTSNWDDATGAYQAPTIRRTQTVAADASGKSSETVAASLGQTGWEPQNRDFIKISPLGALIEYRGDTWDFDEADWATQISVLQTLNPNGSPDVQSVETVFNSTSELLLDSRRTFGYDPVLGSKAEIEPEIRIFPNPTADFAQVFLSQKAADLSLFDQKGQLVWHKFSAAGAAVLDLKPLATGVYFLKIEEKGGGSATRRIIKN